MRRRIQQKISSPLKQEERKKVSDSLNIDKKNLENLQSKIELNKKDLKEGDKLLLLQKTETNKAQETIQKRIKEVSLLDKQILEKKKALKDLNTEFEKVDIGKYSHLAEIHKDTVAIEEDGKKKVEVLDKEVSVLEEKKTKANEELKIIKDEAENASVDLQKKKKEVKPFDKIIEDKTEEIRLLDKKIVELEPEGKKVDELKEIKDGLDQDINSLKQGIKSANVELEVLANKKKKRMAGVVKKEAVIQKKEEALESRIIEVAVKEEHVKKLGGTLQKYFDKLQMPIKVFK